MEKWFFGQYLVERGAVTEVELQSVLAYQQENRFLLGTLAIQRGYLSESQVAEVVWLQQRSRQKFGEIAFERGYLTEAQLEELLSLQAQNQVYLGEALVGRGVLAHETVAAHLAEYEKGLQRQRRAFYLQLGALTATDIVRTALEVTGDYLLHLGLNTKAGSVLAWETVRAREGLHGVFSEQEIDRRRHYYGLLVPAAILDYLCHVIEGDSRDLTFEDKYDSFDELVHNLSFVICRELSRSGRRVKPGPSVQAPAGMGEGVMILLQSPLAPLYVASGFGERSA